MLNKINNVWNFIIRKKKLTNWVNLYDIKNNFNATNLVSTTLVFYIVGLKSIKLKHLDVIYKRDNPINYYKLFYLILIIFFFSLFFFFITLL